MKRSLKFASHVCAVVGLILLAAGAGASLRSSGGGGLVVDAREKSFGSVKAGTVFPVTFTLRNRSSEPVYVAGFTQKFCMATGCVKAEGLPLTIPSGGTGVVTLRVDARKAGEFDAPLTLYTSCPGSGKFDIKVTGRVIGVAPITALPVPGV